MRNVFVLLCGVLLFAIVGCEPQKIDPRFSTFANLSEPIIADWSPNSTFKTWGPVMGVGQLQMERVIIERTEDGALFSAMVIPPNGIIPGSTVTISQVRYAHSPTEWNSFLVVRSVRNH